MKERLAALESRFGSVEDRIERIVSVLPDIKVKIAYEAVYGPFKTAVLVTRPNEDQFGSWGMNIHLLDTARGDVLRYRASMQGPGDDRAIIAVKGWMYTADQNIISLEEIQQYAMEIQRPTNIPDLVLKAASGISHVRRDVFIDPASLKAIEARSLDSLQANSVNNWDELSRLLKSYALFK